MTSSKKIAPLVLTAVLFIGVTFFVFLEHYSPRYNAEYVGAEVCLQCHGVSAPDLFQTLK